MVALEARAPHKVMSSVLEASILLGDAGDRVRRLVDPACPHLVHADLIRRVGRSWRGFNSHSEVAGLQTVLELRSEAEDGILHK
eukprot:751286-Hanusia_phi.AAC.5